MEIPARVRTCAQLQTPFVGQPSLVHLELGLLGVSSESRVQWLCVARARAHAGLSTLSVPFWGLTLTKLAVFGHADGWPALRRSYATHGGSARGKATNNAWFWVRKPSWGPRRAEGPLGRLACCQPLARSWLTRARGGKPWVSASTHGIEALGRLYRVQVP